MLAVSKLPFLAAFLSAPAMQFCLQEGRFSAKIGEILRLHRAGSCQVVHRASRYSPWRFWFFADSSVFWGVFDSELHGWR